MNVTTPTLMYVRGWSETDHPAGAAFVDELRTAGVDVIDVYVPPAGLGDISGWARATIEVLDRHRAEGEPLHLLCYCIGGNLGLEVVYQLEARNDAPAYVGLIDVRRDLESFRLARGIDSLYIVPWGMRLRMQLIRLTPPNRETLGAVLGSILRRSVRSVIELPKRGWRSRKRRRGVSFDAMRFTYACEIERIVTPVHLYNSPGSTGRFTPGDPSLNIGQYLSGGYCVRSIEGDHEHCLDPAHAPSLIAMIEADRARVSGS